MLQGKACLLSLPGALLPPTPAFCSARPPLILRREKKRNILLLTLLHLLTSQNPSPPLSPLSPSPSHFPSRPLAPRPPLKNPDLLLPHCSPPLGRQGSTDWWWCEQLGGRRPGSGGPAREAGLGRGRGTFPGLGRHPTSPRVTSDHLGTHTHRLWSSAHMIGDRRLSPTIVVRLSRSQTSVLLRWTSRVIISEPVTPPPWLHCFCLTVTLSHISRQRA